MKHVHSFPQFLCDAIRCFNISFNAGCCNRGLIYRMSTPVRLTLLIFVSGKVVFTGAKRKSDIDLAWHTILPVLKQFQKV